MLGVGATQGERLCDFFVDDDVDLDASLGCGEEHLIKSILLVLGWGSTQVQLGRQPPAVKSQL